MKKKIFMVLSAVVVLAMGVLVVACSKDSNALNPNEVISVEEVAPAPTLQQTNSAAEWAAFNLEVEKLNEKYKSTFSTAMRAPGDTTVSREIKDIVFADAAGIAGGVLGGLEFLTNLLTVTGGTSYSPHVVITTVAVCGVVSGALASWAAACEHSVNTGTEVSINPLSSISDITGNSMAIGMARQHNIFVSSLKADNFNTTGLTQSQLLTELVERYEDLFGAIDNTVKRQILRYYSLNLPELDNRIVVAHTSFRLSTEHLNKAQLKNYTEEYIRIAERTLSNDEEKLQVACYAATTYYSGALWTIN